MKPFWPAVIGVLFVTLCVWPHLLTSLIPFDLSYHHQQLTRRLIGYPATVVLLTVVWAIACRPQLERGRVSLAAIFALLTILAAGLCFARYALSLSF